MTLLTLGMAEEFRDYGIAVNSLWPRTFIATAALEFEVGAAIMNRSRTPAIMADAAYEILCTTGLELTGSTTLDEDILRERGQTDFAQYDYLPGCTDLMTDLYVD
jgi:citronellol/citronellal dehydrogenase